MEDKSLQVQTKKQKWMSIQQQVTSYVHGLDHGQDHKRYAIIERHYVS